MFFKIVIFCDSYNARPRWVCEIEGLLNINGQSGQCPRLGYTRRKLLSRVVSSLRGQYNLPFIVAPWVFLSLARLTTP